MVRANLDWARRQGLAIVKLGVVTGNATAIHCYLNCGFTVYGVEPQAIFLDGKFYDELLMGLKL